MLGDTVAQTTSDGGQVHGGCKLEVEGLSVEYYIPRSKETYLAIEDVSFQVKDGEFVSIVGPSGCGKTTFLSAIDGLIPIARGRMLLDGRPITGPTPGRAMVFQQASLLPWRTVLGNVRYGLELQRRPRQETQDVAKRFISMVGLTGWENRFPNELSGGMQQRVNLARALATDPEMLLLDEPFANLDAQTREFMQYELLKVWQQTRKTAIFITHQINEAIYLSDRVVVFTSRPGRVKSVVEVDLPRPRKLSIKRSPRFTELEDIVWSHIEEEVRKEGLLAPED